jgi:hypothetical protein
MLGEVAFDPRVDLLVNRKHQYRKQVQSIAQQTNPEQSKWSEYNTNHTNKPTAATTHHYKQPAFREAIRFNKRCNSASTQVTRQQQRWRRGWRARDKEKQQQEEGRQRKNAEEKDVNSALLTSAEALETFHYKPETFQVSDSQTEKAANHSAPFSFPLFPPPCVLLSPLFSSILRSAIMKYSPSTL